VLSEYVSAEREIMERDKTLSVDPQAFKTKTKKRKRKRGKLNLVTVHASTKGNP
jgi:hypothetical protein